MHDVFLSFNGRDRRDVEYIAVRLRERNVDAFMDRWYLVPGQPWPEALDAALSACRSVAVFLGREGLGRWQQREAFLALDRQTRDPSIRVMPILLPGSEPALGFLSLNTWVDLRGGITDEAAIDLVVRAVKGESGPVGEVSAVTGLVSPYRGLRPFREEDAPLFFGREVFVESLVEAVSRRSVVAVIGPSGSGKSSVVMAGLIPKLRRDPAVTWEVVSMVPGPRPLHALAAALLPLLQPDAQIVDLLREVGRLADALGDGSIDVRDLVSHALEKQPGTDRLVLVVDQWEELYTLATDPLTTTAFVEGLLDASIHPDFRVVLTMRGDFYGHALAHRRLADRLQEGIVNISAMTESELETAITGPARAVGVDFEPGLVARILADVGDEPGNMPLLEFMLDELWKDCRG